MSSLDEKGDDIGFDSSKMYNANNATGSITLLLIEKRAISQFRFSVRNKLAEEHIRPSRIEANFRAQTLSLHSPLIHPSYPLRIQATFADHNAVESS